MVGFCCYSDRTAGLCSGGLHGYSAGSVFTGCGSDPLWNCGSIRLPVLDLEDLLLYPQKAGDQIQSIESGNRLCAGRILYYSI